MTNPPAQTPAAALAPIADPLDEAGAGSSDAGAASAAGTAAVDSMTEIGESERDPVGEAEAAVLSTGEEEEEEGKEPAATTPNGVESKKDA